MFLFPSLPSSSSRSPLSQISLATLAFSLIQTEAKCINCVSVCIKREKIVYTHASAYIFILYTYNYAIKVLLCPVSFVFLSFIVLYNVQIVSNFSLSRFIQFDLIAYSLQSFLSFSLSHFILIQIVYNRSIHL